MKRGEVWTVAGASGYAGKPRPVVILQGDVYADLDSVTICPLTSDPVDLPQFRISIEPTEGNGLRAGSRVMADKVTTVQRSKLGRKIGRITDADLRRVSLAVLSFLELAP